MKKLIFVFTFISFAAGLFAQEALKSTEEEYYDFLSLQGLIERPTLGYRTLSDSVWNLSEDTDHIWSSNNLGTTNSIWEPASPSENWFTNGLYQGFKYKIFGPEWFNSYNTAAPYGQNDGGLWQGRGYNTSLTAGARLEGYGFELTFKPQVSWMENRDFEYIKPNYSGTSYENKADTYGYYGVPSIDAPQRFGPSSIFNFDWGDSETRWSWNTFTIGFGTQTIWLGPAKLNPIIHSNNAPSYPKLDIGLRKTELIMPHFGWNLGKLEGRCWWGKLSESEWFDNDEENNNNLITGFSLYYQLPFMKDFTIGINRTMLSKWKNLNPYTTLGIIIPGISSLTSGGEDESDQRFSIIFDYVNNSAGWELYFEWARNDFSPNFTYILRYPFHTQGWTFGTEKVFDFPFNLKCAILLELTFLECSDDYDRLIGWYSTFYAHHQVTQGYTNKGQWLGAGIGTGGNSQYIGFIIYFPKGTFTLFGQRRNPDLDYTMYIDSRKQKEDFNNKKWTAEANIRANIDFGINYTIFINNNLNLGLDFVFNDEHNPLNDNPYYYKQSSHRFNFVFGLDIKYSI